MEEHLAIKLDSVTKEYPGVTALKNVNLNIKQGSIHAFLGPNGAGKSTTMKIISGLIPATSGKVEVLGMDIEEHGREVSNLIGFLPENPPLYKNMAVDEFLKFVFQINSKRGRDYRPALERVLETCGLTKVSKRMIGHLSKGYKQRVGMAQALIYNPPILIFDEPTVGLDPQALEEIRKLILSLSLQHTILLSTHQLHEASLICTDLTIINDGVVVREGGIKDIQQSLQTTQTLCVSLLNWNKTVESALKQAYQISDLRVEREGDVANVEISLAASGDQRAELSHFFINQGCSLLGFSEKQMDLEGIFKKTTTEIGSEVLQ